jgi:anhydro-N-acetylmuramic acid kinase
MRSRSAVESVEKLVIGLMSGSSLDGIDAALVAISGSGETLKVELRDFVCAEFDQATKTSTLELFEYGSATVDKVCMMNAVLGERFADAAHEVAHRSGTRMDDVSLIGAWPQMVYHLPARSNPFEWEGRSLGACLQIGDLNRVAERTGVTTIGSFCSRDIAAGGNGAPLTGLGDYVLYRDSTKNRIVQNIGGIANANLVPAVGGPDAVIGFDTGPGNMIIDGLVRHYSAGQQDYDADGQMAARGTVDSHLLETLLATDSFINQQPPKAAGRENYGEHYVRRLVDMAHERGLDSDSTVATATAFTAESIALSYRTHFETRAEIDEVIVGGGGTRNTTLMGMLSDRLAYPVFTDEHYGIPSFAKEAMYMALIAHETWAGRSNNFPSVTGARSAVSMGAIYPGRGWGQSS